MDQEEKKNNQRRQPKKHSPENLNVEIPKEKKEEDKLKQPSLNQFLQFTKLRIDGKGKDKMEEEELAPRNPEYKSREASIMEVFYGALHLEGRINQVVKT